MLHTSHQSEPSLVTCYIKVENLRRQNEAFKCGSGERPCRTQVKTDCFWTRTEEESYTYFKCHGRRFSLPIPRFLDIATTQENFCAEAISVNPLWSRTSCCLNLERIWREMEWKRTSINTCKLTVVVIGSKLLTLFLILLTIGYYRKLLIRALNNLERCITVCKWTG